MLPDPPEMQNARLEEIDRGQTDAFEFRITGETLRVFADLLAAEPEAGGLGREPGRTSSTCRTCCRFSCSPHFRGDLPAGGLRDVSGVLGRG